jgi:hypothetical protein
MIAWHPWALTGIVAAVVAWSMAWFIYRATPDRALARRTAVLMFVEGAAVLTSGAGVALLLMSSGAYRIAVLVHFGVDWLFVGLYLPFLARALDLRILRVFKARLAEIALLIGCLAGAVSVGLVPGWYIGDVLAVAGGSPLRWFYAPGPVWSYLAACLGLIFICGFLLSLFAWRRARAELLRRRARAFSLAFGIRALVWGGIYLLAAFASARLTPSLFFLLLQLYALTLLAYVVLVSYAVLTAQLFDIDLRIRWTVRQSTVAAAFLAVFFFVSEGVQTFLSVQLGNFLGVAAAALLVFFIAPLRRVADRVADFAVPVPRSSSDYEAFRKLQIYHAALEGVYSDNQVAAKERLILERLKGALDIAHADAERLERDMRRTGVEAGPPKDLIAPGPDAYSTRR